MGKTRNWKKEKRTEDGTKNKRKIDKKTDIHPDTRKKKR